MLTAAAGIQGVTAVAFCWLVMYAGASSANYDDQIEGGFGLLLNRADLALRQGLWLPLLGFPAASAVLGFLLPIRAAWPRIAVTVLGAGAITWMLVWRWGSVAWVLAPVGYIALCVLLTWTPGVTAWLRARPRPSDARPPHHPPPHQGTRP